MGFENLLEAIVDDDTQRVAALLAADARLAQASVAQARLYEEGIFHWLYDGAAPGGGRLSNLDR